MSAIQMGPIIYVQNKTDEDLEDIYFTIDGYDKQDPVINKIKSGQTKTTSICTRTNLRENVLGDLSKFGLDKFKTGYQVDSRERILYLYHFDRRDRKRKYIVLDKLKANNFGNIKVIISKINEDGSLIFSVVSDYDPLKVY